VVNWSNLLLDAGIDVPLERDQFNISCPFHIDELPSCSINVALGKWICFAGCGQGSLVSFLSKFTGQDIQKVQQNIANSAVEFDFDFFEDEFPIDWMDNLPKELSEVEYPGKRRMVPEWIFDRGFSRETLKAWDCGMNDYGDLIIPVYDAKQRLVGWMERRIDALPKYLYSKGLRKSQLLFGEHKIQSTQTICITEGALDTMWLTQNGYTSIALLGASFSYAQQNRLKALHPEEIVLCLDNDEAGQIAIDKINSCMRDSCMVSWLELPKKVKDVQDIRQQALLKQVIDNRVFW
jgi:DNA primase|tara:strand:+ start:84 stop:962 length:879 start_codon:yes stop_codon:yes gene_type:complete